MHGLEGVSLDDIGAASGVHRAAIRHFVGNRDQLVVAALDEITRRSVSGLGALPDAASLARALFASGRVTGLNAENEAWNALLPAALRLPEGRALVRQNYDRLIVEIAEVLRREYPDAAVTDVRDTAYAIACLAEHDFVFQHLGYPRARSKGAMSAALALADRLG